MTRYWRRSLCIALGLTVLAQASHAGAQTEERLALGLSAGRSTLRLTGPAFGYESLSGMVFGVEGRGSHWGAHVRGEYQQGWLERPGGGSSRTVLARASLGVRPIPWMAVTGGPVFSIVDGERRVTRWRVEVHGSGPMVAGLVRGFLTVGAGVAGTDFALAGPMSGGGRAGVVVRTDDSPIWGAIAFRMDRAALTGGSWQTAQTTSLTLGMFMP